MRILEKKQTQISNREKIINSAITLFSIKGYEAVTMREIAAQVGIKAASIYNHFSGKEAILNEITRLFGVKLNENVYPSFSFCQEDGLEAFIEKTSDAMDCFFSQPINAEIGNILLKEQFHNDTVRLFLLCELIEKPREAISICFQQLMQNGQMRPLDSMMVAKEYHAFFIYEFYENALSKGMSIVNSRAQFERNEHIRLFILHYAL